MQPLALPPEVAALPTQRCFPDFDLSGYEYWLELSDMWSKACLHANAAYLLMTPVLLRRRELKPECTAAAALASAASAAAAAVAPGSSVRMLVDASASLKDLLALEPLLVINIVDKVADRCARACFPAEAPPPVAAALAGGALLLLERQMRRTVTKLLRKAAAGGRSFCGGKGYSPLRPCHDVLCSIHSASSPNGAAPAVLSRLGLVLSLALPEWVPELSRLALRAAAEDEAAWREEQGQGKRAGEQRGTDGEAADDNLRLLSLTRSALLGTPLALSLQLATSSVPAAAEGSAAVGSAAVTPDSSADGACRGEGGPDSSGGEMAWRLAGLPEVELVGAALGLLHRRTPDPSDATATALYGGTAECALRLASMRPSDVRALAVDGSASASGGASASAWRPEAVRSVAEAMRRAAEDNRSEDKADVTKFADALATLARHLQPLAAQLEAWAAGEEGDGGGGRWLEAYDEARTACSGDLLCNALAPFLVPPAEARRRLGLPPACSNPACANLAGDSEAGLRLQRCGRCGQASYCCRDCQTAHWKTGHKEACGGGGGKAG